MILYDINAQKYKKTFTALININNLRAKYYEIGGKYATRNIKHQTQSNWLLNRLSGGMCPSYTTEKWFDPIEFHAIAPTMNSSHDLAKLAS